MKEQGMDRLRAALWVLGIRTVFVVVVILSPIGMVIDRVRGWWRR